MPKTVTNPTTTSEDRRAAAIVGAIFLVGFFCGLLAQYILEVVR